MTVVQPARRVPQSASAAPERSDLLLKAVAVMLLTYVWRVQDVLPVLGTVKVGMLAAAATVVALASSRAPIRKLGAIHSPVLTAILVILGLMILGVPTSLWSGKSFNFVTRDFGQTLVLMVAVAASIRSIRDLEWLMFVAVAGGAFYSAFVLVNFQVGPNGRLGNLVYYDANDFALLLVCTIPIALYFAQRGTPKPRRVVALVALPLLLLMVVKSGSRGGFLAFLAVTLYVLLRFRAFPVHKRLTAVGVGVVLLLAVANAAYWEQMSTLLNPKQDYNWAGKEQSGRMEIWKRGIGYMLQRPITGVGARAFPQAEGTLSTQAQLALARGRGFKWSAAHNSFVEIGAEVGVIALGAFVAMFFFAFRSLAKATRGLLSYGPGAARLASLSQALTASLIGYVVAGFFLSAAYASYLYVLLGLTLGFLKLLRWQGTVAAPTVAAAAPAAWRTAASAAARDVFVRQAVGGGAGGRPAHPTSQRTPAP